MSDLLALYESDIIDIVGSEPECRCTEISLYNVYGDSALLALNWRYVDQISHMAAALKMHLYFNLQYSVIFIQHTYSRI